MYLSKCKTERMIGIMCMSIWMSEKDNYSWDIPPCINKCPNDKWEVTRVYVYISIAMVSFL